MKKIKKAENRQSQKIKERDSEKLSTNLMTPIFSFEFMRDSYHCVDCCNDDDLVYLLKKIRTLSKMTWGQMSNSPRHGLGYEIISNDSIKEAIPPNLLQREDINFISIRYYGLKPMIGFRQDRIFNIIWIDNDFTVYDH